MRGFTIIEIIVSIAIIGLLTGVMLANYRGGAIKTDLVGATHKVVSDIRVAQNYSLGTREFNGITPLGGWGVRFDITNPTEYIIFADKDGDANYDADELYTTNALPLNMEISEISGDSPVDIVFLPPDPQTIITANGMQVDNLTVTIKEKINNSIQQLQVNFLGLIDLVE